MNYPGLQVNRNEGYILDNNNSPLILSIINNQVYVSKINSTGHYYFYSPESNKSNNYYLNVSPTGIISWSISSNDATLFKGI